VRPGGGLASPAAVNWSPGSAGLDWPRLVPIDAANQRLAEKPPLHASFFRTIEKWE
jgi:hypothetical protein